MLFNSYSFLLIFLPIVICVYYWATSRYSKAAPQLILLVASLYFYAFWNIYYLPLLVASILINFLVGNKIFRSDNNEIKKNWLIFGLLANLASLIYFKYANFVVDEISQLTQATYNFEKILLPLAISFFTFQQIAYLVDLYKSKTQPTNFLSYALFVSFFPQLIAGPIVRASDVLNQYSNIKTLSLDKRINISIGVAIFLIGLFKKVVIADSLAGFATPVFTTADSGGAITSYEAWVAAISYSFQLYFDFSGYSDMAIGLAKIFGITLPINFYSPYKSTSIIEFWRRWHITLSFFLRDYLYIPLGGNRHGNFRRYANILITMILGGLWHGAGWGFIIWGGIHGVLLALNHLWRSYAINHKTNQVGLKFSKLTGWLFTFIAVTLAWVVFRAETLDGAIEIYKNMLFFNGLSLPADLLNVLGITPQELDGLGVTISNANSLWHITKLELIGYLGMSCLVVFFLPNTVTIFRLSTRVTNTPSNRTKVFRHLIWRPNSMWVIVLTIIWLVSLVHMTNISEFLYFQF